MIKFLLALFLAVSTANAQRLIGGIGSGLNELSYLSGALGGIMPFHLTQLRERAVPCVDLPARRAQGFIIIRNQFYEVCTQNHANDIGQVDANGVTIFFELPQVSRRSRSGNLNRINLDTPVRSFTGNRPNLRTLAARRLRNYLDSEADW